MRSIVVANNSFLAYYTQDRPKSAKYLFSSNQVFARMKMCKVFWIFKIKLWCYCWNWNSIDPKVYRW